ncbi:Protein CBG27084 [Caenorhabditis briggsae]|uniref:Protein CBG27084 n=1 Tax=Caenorhabditis briggsae TaxID=6238 RepID=B6IHG0_CAEBR|nr:Protein CBG27084 [Caenorhabditis briggsae]CAR99340.1 Protein CBG27084 [Caenorhabditis briggsae]
MLLWNNLLSVLNALVYSVENLDGFENGLLDDASIINTTFVGDSEVHQYNQGTEDVRCRVALIFAKYAKPVSKKTSIKI